MTLEGAEAWLRGRIDHERAPGYADARLDLSPIRALLARLGAPELGQRVLHVAGSKGKGSVALMAEALLGAAGRRTGVYTSPHLRSWTERFRIDGVPVDGERLAAAVDRVRPAVSALAGGPDDPTWFDVTTAVGLVLFAEAGVDVTVLEVGLGGRLDSTNAVHPALCCITSIELEHTERLGDTVAAIAAEKAGILKPGIPAVMGRLPEPARAVVEAQAAAMGAPLSRLGHEFDAHGEPDGLLGSRLGFRDGGAVVEVSLGVPGRHQCDNAALALACVRRLEGLSGDELARAAQRALPKLRLPARIEIVGEAPWRVVDAAHTEASAMRLAEVVGRLPSERAHLILSVSVGKDLGAICRALLPHFGRVTATRAEPHRSCPPSEVADTVRAIDPHIDVRVNPNPGLALQEARDGARAGDLVCATGSIYLAGIARDVLGGRGHV